MKSINENLTAAFQPLLDILDEGMLLYRRGFVSFVLIAALWVVPIAVGVGLSVVVARSWGTEWTILLILGWLLLAIPLGIYLIGGLSRATTIVQQERSVRIREALAIPPWCAAGMGCYGSILYLVANMLASSVSSFCFCAFYFFAMALFAGLVAVVSDVGSFGMALVGFIGILFVLVFVLLYGVSMVLGGAAYSTLVYGLQPFVHEKLTFGDAVQRSIDLITHRLGRNLLAFMLSSAIFGAVTISVTVAIGVLLPLPLWFTLGAESRVFQGVSASAWLLGLIVALPPMPIWMTLLYQRNLHAWWGMDLIERIEQSSFQVIANDNKME